MKSLVNILPKSAFIEYQVIFSFLKFFTIYFEIYSTFVLSS